MRQLEGGGDTGRRSPADNQELGGDGAAFLLLAQGGGEAAAAPRRTECPPLEREVHAAYVLPEEGDGGLAVPAPSRVPVPPSAPMMLVPASPARPSLRGGKRTPATHRAWDLPAVVDSREGSPPCPWTLEAPRSSARSLTFA